MVKVQRSRSHVEMHTIPYFSAMQIDGKVDRGDCIASCANAVGQKSLLIRQSYWSVGNVSKFLSLQGAFISITLSHLISYADSASVSPQIFKPFNL